VNEIRLFVYGTLRRSFPLHCLLDNCKYLGDGWLVGYALYGIHGVPSMVLDKDGGRVYGEIYEVPEDRLGPLDTIQSSYKRTWIDQLGGVWGYIDRLPHFAASGNLIKDGIFKGGGGIR